MPFNSLEFAFFFVLVLGAAALMRSNTTRKALLLIASCYFYAYWDYRFLALLLAGTGVDYALGLISAQSPKTPRKLALYTSLAINLTMLGLFKYYSFFVSSLAPLLSGVGLHPGTLDLVLPLGISFYTFLRISYAIDVYRRTIQPERSLLDFALYTCFFPHVISGPLTRPGTLLAQFKSAPTLNGPVLEAGFRLFCFGLFKKVVLADRLGVYVDTVYTDVAAYDSITVWFATVAYTIEIYLDFSGYTDMARGTAKAFGYDLTKNFNFPYLSKNPSEFWRRWHISLSGWFRDYLYIPMGGNRQGTVRTCANLLVTMLLCGLWHGAGWTFIFWGGWHGIGLVAHRLLRDRRPVPIASSRVNEALSVMTTLLFVHIGWIFFRASDFKQATIILERMFLGGGTLTWIHPFVPALAGATIAWHWLRYRKGESWSFAPVGAWYTPFCLFSLLGLSMIFAAKGFTPFIYAQF